MSATTALAIAIPALVVAAGVLLFATARRRDTGSATGSISHETTRRDRGPVSLDDEGAPMTGREVERAAALGRRGVPTGGQGRGGAGGVGAAGRGDARRHPPPVLQPLDRVALRLQQPGSRAGRCWRSCGPRAPAASVGKIRVGTLEDINKAIADGNGFAYYPEARMWVTAYPSDALPKAEAVYSPPELVGHGGGDRDPVAEVPAPGLPGAPVRDVAVVRVPLPRLAVQPGG